jgi:hypothetical protein
VKTVTCRSSWRPVSGESRSQRKRLLNQPRWGPRSGGTNVARAVRVSGTSNATVCPADDEEFCQIMGC